MKTSVTARLILNVAGLAMIGIALFHFFGIYAVIGLFGFVLRYNK